LRLKCLRFKQVVQVTLPDLQSRAQGRRRFRLPPTVAPASRKLASGFIAGRRCGEAGRVRRDGGSGGVRADGEAFGVGQSVTR